MGFPEHGLEKRRRLAEVYRSFDVISPWTVGRIHDIDSADAFQRIHIDQEIQECDELGIEYLPVVFPGYSAHHMSRGLENPPNEIPRLGGDFFWRQLRNAIMSGARMVFVAMMDEVDGKSI